MEHAPQAVGAAAPGCSERRAAKRSELAASLHSSSKPRARWPPRPHPRQALASAANLRALYVAGDEVAQLLTAAARLAALSPALEVDAPLVGAVIGVADSDGALALRRVAAVESLALTPDGE